MDQVMQRGIIRVLREIRLEMGISKVDLADILHVTPAVVFAWESGKTRPKMSNAKQIVILARENKIKVSIDDFF